MTSYSIIASDLVSPVPSNEQFQLAVREHQRLDRDAVSQAVCTLQLELK